MHLDRREFLGTAAAASLAPIADLPQRKPTNVLVTITDQHRWEQEAPANQI